MWYFHKPNFEYEKDFQDFDLPWAGHKFFGYDLIRNFRPRKIVELGTYRGTSLFSFCQAVKDGKLDTEIFAIDTWEGDKHTSFYGESVFQEVLNLKNRYYSDLKIHLVRKTFDETVSDFADNSIDLLHIDGLHTYEAVKHDFQTWIEKVSDQGIVLFHDIAVFQDDFGVYKLWNELKEIYKTIEFQHSHGLGILCKNPKLSELFSCPIMWQNYYDVLAREPIVKANIASNEENISMLKAALQEKDAYIQQVHSSRGWKFLMRYYKLRDALLPPDSSRKFYMKFLLKAISNPQRILKNVNKENINKFYYHLQAADRTVLQEKIMRKLSLAHEGNISKFKIDFDGEIKIDQLKRFEFPCFEAPVVSIIIPLFNKWRYTYHCLKTLITETNDVPYEVIVIDNASTDETSELLGKFSNLHKIWNNSNLGFVEACNQGANASKGTYLLFLNNDTQVSKDWLRSMVELAQRDNQIGAVGAKLIYPDGRLQEAGGIVWNDKHNLAWNYGKYDNPDNYEYNYIKEVDYCSGACLLVRKELFQKLGGFDLQYAPAYCEDSDIAFGIRKLGYKVMYQPKAEIIHFEGITAGTDTSQGIKQFQIVNQNKFFNKWDAILKNEHFANGQDVFLARDRSQGKKIILFIDHYVPTWDKDAGSLTIYMYLKLFLELGFKIIFIPDNFSKLEPYTTVLNQLGIEVLYGKINFKKWISKNGKYLNYIWLSRPHISIKYIESIKTFTKAKSFYYMHDFHYIRELRQYQILKRPEILKEAERIKKMEFKMFNAVSLILTPSDSEVELVNKFSPDKPVKKIPGYFYEDTSIAVTNFTPFHQRKDIMFLGGFVHTPNIDAVEFFLRDIFPGIRRYLPSVKFHIIGSNLPKKLQQYAGPDILTVGYVKDLSAYFKNIRVFVAPLRYGAGVNGKIVTSMLHGVPVVTTNIGNEGLRMVDAQDCMIADNPDEFSIKVVKLYEDQELWEQLSLNSLKFIKRHFSKSAAKATIETLVEQT